jgi:hypothetical protein
VTGEACEASEDIERLHARLQCTDAATAGTVSSLRARLDALDERAFNATLPAQALHGDESLSNLLHTPHYVIGLRNRGASSSFAGRMLDAYGWGDEQELAPFIAAHGVYDEIWQMYDRQRHSPAKLNRQTTPCNGLHPKATN